ncbi:MAG: DNA polymerase I [Chitinophagaceae bacterium]|nr:DNA polymerase I [Chitinophagaceae bacterium]
MEKKLFLLDAMALIYRSYYSLIRRPIITTTGKNTNAQFVFTNTLYDLLNKEKPTHLAVAFDTAAPTERHEEFEDYKANRQEVPEDIIEAIPDIKEIIRGFKIPVIEYDGYEADDIIGTLAKQAEEKGYTVYMVTPDKDFGQLVTENILIYKPGYQGGSVEIMGEKEVCEKWDISNVSQVIDILGLMGDASDNIPGIPGVGEKTAAKLLKEYGTLENVLKNAEHIKGALGKKVQEGKELAEMSKRLATILTDVPCKFHEKDFRVESPDKEKLKDIFTRLEFKTLGKRILGEGYSVFDAGGKVVQADLFGNVPVQEKEKTVAVDPSDDAGGLVAEKNIENTPHEYILADSDTLIYNLVQELKHQKEIAFDTETTGLDANEAELVGMSFCFKPHKAYYVPFPDDRKKAEEILKKLEPVFHDEKKRWIGHNIKFDLLILRWYGADIKGKLFDTMLAHYLIESEGRRNMDLLSAQYLGYVPVPITDLIGKKGKGQGNMKDVAHEEIKEYASEDADVTFQLKQVFEPILEEREVVKVFERIEMPLVRVLRDMEFEGVNIDVDFLKAYSKELEKEAVEAEEKVFEQSGIRFNLSSPKQLGEVLFDKMQIGGNVKKTRGGQYATGEDVLLKLAKDNPIIEDILNYRELTKLRSTYVDALPQLINPKTGRVHTSYGQAIAVTGRLSSNNPNLQNIPVRTARGREIRKAFIPRDKHHLIISADYSQIELRVVAAVSGDKAMIDSFKHGKDIHTATAARIFKVPEEEVTKEMRYKAKSVNFGIIYGQSAFGLAENINVSRSEAKEIIDEYKKQFPGIDKYMQDTIEFCRTNGYVQTLMGRKRWLKDINSKNWTVRGFAERTAINSPIQGSAADMIKLAMIDISEVFAKHKFKSRMILQVHDELVFDAHKDEVDTIRPLILESMINAMPLPHGVPVNAEIGIGHNWLEAH